MSFFDFKEDFNQLANSEVNNLHKFKNIQLLIDNTLNRLDKLSSKHIQSHQLIQHQNKFFQQTNCLVVLYYQEKENMAQLLTAGVEILIEESDNSDW
ncbi:hypothetical protein SS50377_25130 [Spironucleus salmonicida]|uniref:Uncharacterized protein n=1 Tax=Spironucleus salmonicida TaxID=348837 RepID=A0A9P8LRY2_9EUKA|nr:hypothetical protein SS50377_25130 [Spironucleus salmonicida]